MISNLPIDSLKYTHAWVPGEVVKRFGDQILAPSSRDATRDYGLKKISREMCESLLQQDMSKDVASLGTGLTVARETLTLLSNSRPLLQAALTGGRVAALAGTAVAAPEIILSAAAGIAATHLASNVFYSVAKGSGSSSSSTGPTSRVSREYKSGNRWDELIKDKDSATAAGLSGKRADEIAGDIIRVKRLVGGEVRADVQGNFYKFDPAHQSAKVHLEKIVKRPDGFYGVAEVDPVTGNIIREIPRRHLGK